MAANGDCVAKMQQLATSERSDAIPPDDAAPAGLPDTAVSLPLYSTKSHAILAVANRAFENLIQQTPADGRPCTQRQSESPTTLSEAAGDFGCPIPVFRRLCAVGEPHGD